MNHGMILKPFFYLVFPVLFVGCSLTENMDKLAAETENLGDTSDRLERKTREMLEEMKALRELTRELSQHSKWLAAGVGDQRQEISSRFTITRMGLIEKATTLEAKRFLAGTYFAGFEFQLWKNYAQDNQEYLDYLQYRAVEEFMAWVSQYFEGLDLNEIDLPSQNLPKRTPKEEDGFSRKTQVEQEKLLNLYALSLALHIVNERQHLKIEPIEENSDLKMIGFVQRSIRAGIQIDRGEIQWEDLLSYQKILQTKKQRERIFYLLELRSNLLVGMVLAHAERQTFPVLKVKLILDQFPLGDLKDFVRFFQESTRVYQFLMETKKELIGKQPLFNRTLETGMRVLQIESRSERQERVQLAMTLEEEVLKMKDFLGEDKTN